jgi:prevent-host-death family protein
MDVPMSKAKAQLTELVRRAEAGEEVVLTRHGKPAVK